MASKSIVIQTRDQQLLADLLQSPYEAEQLWQLSESYDRPFTDVHFVRRRMRLLRDARFVHIFQYATQSSGRLNYYRLTERGYALVCGADKRLPPKGQFRPIAPALQRHVRALSQLLVKIRTSAATAKLDIPLLLGDQQVRFEVQSQAFVPDAAFTLRLRGLSPRHFLVEVDCGTEPLYSVKQRDSLRKKLELYYAHEASAEGSYRVLFLFTEATPRVASFLQLAKQMAPDPRRHVVLAAVQASVLEHDDPLRWPIFLDHDHRLVSLMPCPDPNAAALEQPSLLPESWFAAVPLFG